MTLALKLKLDVEPDQLPLLNEMFCKWASICNRISIKKEGQEALNPPDDADGVWFNRTQLNQAKTDVSDLQKALQKQQKRLEYEQDRLIDRRDTIKKAIDDKNARDISPENNKLFRPKEWIDAGLLKTNYHYERGWLGKIKVLQRQIDRKLKTIKRISAGKIKFKPKRISLHQNSFKVRFGSEPKIELSPLENGRTELKITTTPVQPLRGSSLRSAQYLQAGVLNLLAYATDSLLFGLSRSEEMLMKSKTSEKIDKRNKKLETKKENFDKKVKQLEKWLDRALTQEEKQTIQTAKDSFFKTMNHAVTEEYRQLLEKLSKELEQRQEYLSIKKYPILIRKPKPAYKHKKIANLKQNQWDYFIQFGYEPLLEKPNAGNPKTVLGIDRGLTHLLAVSILDPENKKFIFNRLYPNPIEGWKWRQRKLKRSIQNLERRIRAQKDVHIFENQMKKSLRSTENRIETHLHELSRKIVESAKEHNSTIVMEELASMKQHGRKKNKRTGALDYALSLFDYGKIAQLIAYKSKQAGVPVYTVLPAGTSQNCAKCLLEGRDSHDYARGKIEKITKNGKGIERNNLKRGACKTCSANNPKSEIDADLNAARVIALCYHKNINQPLPVGERTKRNF